MKHSGIAAILALISLLIFSELDFFKTIFWFPNFLWILPLYILFRISSFYFTFVFGLEGVLSKKLLFVAVNVICVLVFFKLGFAIWKTNQGNILTAPLQEFQINLKNIWFWILYQSYLILFFFSAFKQLVTIK